MTNHDLHTEVFVINHTVEGQITENWRRVKRTIRMISDELEYVRLAVGLREMDVNGVNSDSITNPHVAEELQCLLSLALALRKEALVLRDICPGCPTGQDGAADLIETVNRIKRELRRAFSASGTIQAPSRLSLYKGKFNLRVYLCGAGPTVYYPSATTSVALIDRP